MTLGVRPDSPRGGMEVVVLPPIKPTRPPHDVANRGDSQTQRHVPKARLAVLQFSHQARMLPTHHIDSVITLCARLVFNCGTV